MTNEVMWCKVVRLTQHRVAWRTIHHAGSDTPNHTLSRP